MQVGQVPQDVLGTLCSWEGEMGTLPTLFLYTCGISPVVRSTDPMKCNILDTVNCLNNHLVFIAASGGKERGYKFAPTD